MYPSSLCRSHANLLCIVPLFYTYAAKASTYYFLKQLQLDHQTLLILLKCGQVVKE